jgi:NAD(P)-dependent dehydrogenase (short-subunit alcohol dehydrogenase family)
LYVASSFLAEHLIVVTGSARGLGFAIAENLLREGASVHLVDNHAERLANACTLLAANGFHPQASVVDIADESSVAAFATSLPDNVWGLVNNAALADSVGGKNFWDIDVAAWDHLMGVNVRGTWLMSKHLATRLQHGGEGRIVNLASDAALYGSPRLSHYIASKGAVISLTRAMARDIGPYGVTVNAVAPGIVETESTQGVPAERHELYRMNRAIARPQQPEDVVGAVGFLLSPAASYITGQTLVVDGGFIMH